MRFSPRSASRVVVLGSVLLGSLVAACGSDAGPSAPVASSQELLCASKGIHVESCGEFTNPGTPPKPPLLSACLRNPVCPSPATLTPLAGFDSVAIADAVSGSTCLAEWQDTDFPGQLKAAGCSTAYHNDADTRSSWAFAFCPTAAPIVTVPDAVNVGVLPCDTCTGAAPAGFYILAFEVFTVGDAGSSCHCDAADPADPDGHCHPSGGCDEVSCLQNGLNEYTPVTVAPVTLPGGG